MLFSLLTDEQVLALLAEQPRMLSVPGVALVLPEFVSSKSTEVAVVATVYPGNHQEIARLPIKVAGLPVVVKVVERGTRRVLEVIDPRKNGGAWPRIGHSA